jgi:hypothetical protein
VDVSLTRYLQYLYIEYPEWVRIRLNERPVELSNPLSVIKKYCSPAFYGEKSEKFAVQLLQEDQLRLILGPLKSETALIRGRIADQYKSNASATTENSLLPESPNIQIETI